MQESMEASHKRFISLHRWIGHECTAANCNISVFFPATSALLCVYLHMCGVFADAMGVVTAPTALFFVFSQTPLCASKDVAHLHVLRDVRRNAESAACIAESAGQTTFFTSKKSR